MDMKVNIEELPIMVMKVGLLTLKKESSSKVWTIPTHEMTQCYFTGNFIVRHHCSISLIIGSSVADFSCKFTVGCQNFAIIKPEDCLEI